MMHPKSRVLGSCGFRRAAALAVGALTVSATVTGCDRGSAPPESGLDAAGPSAAQRPLMQDRFTIHESTRSHADTLDILLRALDRRDLNVFAVIDHAAGAENAGLTLAPSTLVIFGNPQAGTGLMQAEALMGAELPLRALVYQRGDVVYVALTGIGFLERSYNLGARKDVLDKMKDTLAAIATEATGQR